MNGKASLDLSVVCPFYNESVILEHAIRSIAGQMSSLPCSWELIVVNDGSVDGSGDIARKLQAEIPNLRVEGYARNRGRGYALRTGIASARGDVIVTTEIDLSWGADIVHRLYAAMQEWPDADIIVASPHLPGGGYRNVPFKRVLLSQVGNLIIRACVSNAVSMNTGMTRAYRRSVIQGLPVAEDGKEFHLDVILKATSLGLHLREIPAILEWKGAKVGQRTEKRKSSTRVGKIVASHSLFSLIANPVRYVWAMALLALVLGLASLVWAVVLLYLHEVSAYMALLSLSLVILSVLLFILGVVLKQGQTTQRELWIMQMQILGSDPRRMLRVGEPKQD